MNKDEIKKAIKCCFDYNCAECQNAKIKGYGCKDKLHADALDLITEQEKEIDALKAENARLTEKLGQVLLSIDTVKEMNAMCNIAEQVKQAKIDVLNELKEKSYVNDYCREVVEVEKIDEMIKEIEK